MRTSTFSSGRIVMVLVAVLTLMLCGEVSASAQYNGIYRHGADFYSGKQKLTEGQLSVLLEGVDGVSLSDVARYQKGFRTGKGLLIGFGSLTGAGLLTLGVGTVGVMVEAVATGIGVMFVGPLASLAGEEEDPSVTGKFAPVATAGGCT